jgi:hypothetical protein
MITQETTGRERRASHPGSGYETTALRSSDDLLDLILGGTLSPDGMAQAHGARGLINAVLAFRETVAAAVGDTADAVTDLDATLGIIAGAVTDLDADAEAGLQLAEASR